VGASYSLDMFGFGEFISDDCEERFLLPREADAWSGCVSMVDEVDGNMSQWMDFGRLNM